MKTVALILSLTACTIPVGSSEPSPTVDPTQTPPIVEEFTDWGVCYIGATGTPCLSSDGVVQWLDGEGLNCSQRMVHHVGLCTMLVGPQAGQQGDVL